MIKKNAHYSTLIIKIKLLTAKNAPAEDFCHYEEEDIRTAADRTVNYAKQTVGSVSEYFKAGETSWIIE